jgi:hypothetical protein
MVTGKGDEQPASNNTHALETKEEEMPLDNVNFGTCKTEAAALRRALEA